MRTVAIASRPAIRSAAVLIGAGLGALLAVRLSAADAAGYPVALLALVAVLSGVQGLRTD
jgi:hypothetical protein